MSDASTTSTTAAPATNSGNIFTQIEATLSAEWQSAVAFFKQAETDVATFLSKVASGAAILVADIEAVASYVAAHLTVINSTISAVGTAAATIAPNNVDVAKVVNDLTTAANDTAALSQSLSSGSAAGDPQVVSTAVTAINSVQTLAGLAGQASAAIAQLTAASPTATASVSPPTPPEA